VRIVLQRVHRARVHVDRRIIASISNGLLLLVGIGKGDAGLDFGHWARKIVQLRIFEDTAGRMNLSLQDTGGEILVVSQFTLYGNVHRGRRPSFSEAAPPQEAERLLDAFVRALRAENIPVKTGSFGARMIVELVNDGPVTLVFNLEPSDEAG
jgi:D-tyrosyl-tRNA(Tyr) deacylase